MQLIVNKITYKFIEDTMTISELLLQMKYSYPIIIVKYMSKIIDNNEFDNIYLQDGDSIDIMHIFAGG